MGQELDDRFEQQVLTTGFIHAARHRPRPGTGAGGDARPRTGPGAGDRRPRRRRRYSAAVAAPRSRARTRRPRRNRPGRHAPPRRPGPRTPRASGSCPMPTSPRTSTSDPASATPPERLAESRERGLTPDEIRGPLAAPHNSSLWGTRSERATSASRAPTHRSVWSAYTTQRRYTDTICELVRCTMVRRSRPLQDALSRRTRRWCVNPVRGTS